MKEKRLLKRHVNGREPKHSQETFLLNAQTPFAVTEAYKTLRTNVIFATRKKGCQVFAVSSPFPGEGKTTNAINLAISFAQTEARVLLIDGDLRRPRLHKSFHVTNGTGLSNLLAGLADLEEDVILHTEYAYLDLITSGHIPPNPIELLSSGGMETMLEKLKTRYDYIIIDTPPVNVVSDALVISKLITGYLLVVRQGVTERQALAYAMSKFEMAGVKPLGVILNAVESYTKKYRYRSGYKYKNYYNYYRASH